MKTILNKKALKKYLEKDYNFDFSKEKDIQKSNKLYEEMIKDMYICLAKNGYGLHTKECVHFLGKD